MPGVKSPTLPGSIVFPLRLLLLLAFAIGIAYYAVVSIHWPLMCDAPVLHYVNFLMQHGMQPYQTITDNNMPGAYLTEGWAMYLFGAGDLGWRFYDFFLLFVITLAMVQIARRFEPLHSRDWLAGIFGGCFFALLHGSEGPNYPGEREQVITALLLVGYALLFTAVRRRMAVLLLPFGFICGLAASIKPTALPLGLVLLAFAAYVLRRRSVPVLPFLAWGIAGFALAFAIDFAFLIAHHAVGPFWFVLHTITPSYIALAHPSFGDMLREAMPKDLRRFVVLVALPAALVNLPWRRPGPPASSSPFPEGWNWERWALNLGILFGLFTYFLQHKGFVHHRYTFEAILFFLIGVDLLRALRTPGWSRVIGAAGILSTVFYFVPRYMLELHQTAPNSVLTLAMEQDLGSLGVASASPDGAAVPRASLSALQGKVQCFDLIFGCLNSLYHLGLVENTGFTGDLLFFFPKEGLAVTYYRDMFWREARKDPADVLVVTNEWLQLPNSFDKLKTWPAFDQYLAANYTQVIARDFPMEARLTAPSAPGPGDQAPRAYRIYVRNSSPLLRTAQAVLSPT